MIAKTGGNSMAKAAAFDVMLVLIKEQNRYDISGFGIAELYKT